MACIFWKQGWQILSLNRKPLSTELGKDGIRIPLVYTTAMSI